MKFSKSYLIIFFLFFFLIHSAIANNEIEDSIQFSYYKDECFNSPEEFEDFITQDILATEYNNKDGAILKCNYSKEQTFSITKSKVYLKYNLASSGFYEITTFLNEEDAKKKFLYVKHELLNENWKIKINNSSGYLTFQKTYFTPEDQLNPHKSSQIVKQIGASVIKAYSDIHFLPARSYLLDTRLPQEFIETVIEQLKEDLMYPIPDLFLEKGEQTSFIKEEQQKKKPQILAFNKQIENKYNERNLKYEKRNDFFTRSLCLFFNGLYIDFNLLETFKIEEPVLTCGFILYDELADITKSQIETVDFKDYVDNFDKEKQWCVNSRVKAVYFPVLKNWLERNIDWLHLYTEICPNRCILEEGVAVCD